jgi:hypothetical protein
MQGEENRSQRQRPISELVVAAPVRCHGPGPPHDTYRNDGVGWARSDRPLGGRGAREFRGVIWQRRRPIDGCFGTQQCLSFAPCVVVSSAATSPDVLPGTPRSIITASGSPPALQWKLVKKNGLPTAIGSPSVLRGSGGVFRSNAQRPQRRASEAVASASQRTEGQAHGALATHWKMLRGLPPSKPSDKWNARPSKRTSFRPVSTARAGLGGSGSGGCFWPHPTEMSKQAARAIGPRAIRICRPLSRGRRGV